MKKLLTSLLFLFCLSPLFATDYFVKNGGNDGLSGLDDDNAWETVGKVASEMGGDIGEGDDIYFKRGSSWTGAQIDIGVGGNSGNWMVIGAYDSGDKPSLTNTSAHVITSSTSDLGYIKIENLDITSYASGVGVHFVRDESSGWSNIIVDACDFDTCLVAFMIRGVDTYTFQNCTATNVKNGTYVEGSEFNGNQNGKILNNDINCNDISGSDGIGLHKNDSDGESNGSNHLIEGNVCRNAKENNYDITSGDNIILLDNESYDSDSPGYQIGSSVSVVTDIFIDNCYSEGDRDSFYINNCDDVVIRRSVGYNPTTHRSVTIGSASLPTEYTYLNDNTFWISHNGRDLVLVEHVDTDYIYAKNNIFVRNNNGGNLILYVGAMTYASTISDFDNNMWYRNDNDPNQTLWDGLDLDDWNLGGAVDTYDDPELVNPAGGDFTLQAGSPAINAGTWLTLTNGAGSDSATITVDDAQWFHDGFGLTTGDIIQLEGQSSTLTITAINWGTNVITVSPNATWSDGDGVALAFEGASPDMGAYEFGEGDSILRIRDILRIRNILRIK